MGRLARDCRSVDARWPELVLRTLPARLAPGTLLARQRLDQVFGMPTAKPSLLKSGDERLAGGEPA